VATIFSYAGFGPELVPRKDSENTVDLVLRLSATHPVEVEAKTPRALQFPAEDPIRVHDIPPRDTIKKSLDDARDQFSGDGILAIAGDFWVGGIDGYAEAAANVLAVPLPRAASESVRFVREHLLGILLASLGYENSGRDGVRSRLFLRWVPNPSYSGSVALTWQPDSDGRLSIRLRPASAAANAADVEDDFQRYEENPIFNPARFRVLPANEVEVEGAIVNHGGHTSASPVRNWTFPEAYRPKQQWAFDVASEFGFTVVRVVPDGGLLTDPTAGSIDLHGVKFPVS